MMHVVFHAPVRRWDRPVEMLMEVGSVGYGWFVEYEIIPYDIYVACCVRSLSVVNAFLDEFVPMRSEAAGDYVYPELSHPHHRFIFTALSDVLDVLMVEVSEPMRCTGAMKPRRISEARDSCSLPTVA